MRAVWIGLLSLAVLAPARALELNGPITQGGLVQGKVEPGSQVRLGKRRLRVSPEGVFIIGLGREAPETVTLRVKRPDGVQLEKTLTVAQREYDIQRIDGLPSKKVTPPKAEWDRIAAESKRIRKARKIDAPRTDFTSGFIWPVKGPISGVYGSQRILNGKPKRPHYGLDVAVPEGTPIVAPADGLVSLVHEGMFYTGKTVMLDHGHGLSSLYIHMSEIDVKEGQRVAQGERIGAVGMTGRATGPHLHWGLSWFNTRLDPELLVPERASKD